MNVRTKLGLATAGAALSTATALVIADHVSQMHAAADELEDFTKSLMATDGWLTTCDAAPASWTGAPPARHAPLPGHSATPSAPLRPGPASHELVRPPRAGPPHGGPPGQSPRHHRRPATFLAYGADFAPWAPNAPTIPDDAIAALEGPPLREAVTLSSGLGADAVQVLIRAPSAPGRKCAFIVATGTPEPWLGGVLPKLHVWLLPLLAVCGAVLVAMGPVVRRLRRLTTAVRSAAAHDYAVDVASAGEFGRDEIGRLAEAFDAASHEVQARLAEARLRERALRDFLANTTHDLMIPLTVLQGHLVRLQSPEASATDRATSVGAAMGEAHYVGALVHNLALAARLESGAPTPERHPVSLPALVARVVARHRPIARGLDVSLDAATPESLVIEGDETMLEQAANNLVYNAVRYNRPGGHVAVVLESVVLESSPANGPTQFGFSLSVIDDGPGVPDDVLVRLRERGFRGDAARSRTPGGHGLGLDIADQVARLHEMRLDLRRSEFGGLHAELVGPVPATPGTSGAA